jgi:hypothetical protein
MVDPTKPDGPAPRVRPPYTRRQIISQVAIAAVILISGMGIGTGGTILALRDRIIWHPRRFGPPPPPIGIVEQWKIDYGLTDDQVRRAKEAFTASWENTRKLFVESWQKQQAEQSNFAKSMKAIFTPEQYQKWEQDFKERAEHFRRWRPRPGGGPGGPGGPPGGHKEGHRDRGPFRDDKSFRPPPGREPPPGERGVPPEPNLSGGPGPGPKPE